MKSVGVSHVINMAEGEAPGSVPPMKNQEMFGIHYRGYKVDNLADKTKNEAQLQKLYQATETIDETLRLESCTGLLVNCFAGMSRSASSILAWLVAKKGMNAEGRSQKDAKTPRCPAQQRVFGPNRFLGKPTARIGYKFEQNGRPGYG